MGEQQLKEHVNDLVKHSHESEWLEFKHNFHSEEEIGERLSALSNGACLRNQPFGYLVFGIEDITHRIEDHHYSTASRIIRDTLEEKLIKEEDPENKSRKYASYLPYWA